MYESPMLGRGDGSESLLSTRFRVGKFCILPSNSMDYCDISFLVVIGDSDLGKSRFLCFN